MTLTGQTTVREMLTLHPIASGVMIEKGMCESCQANPPELPLAAFAKKHCGGDLDGLLSELQAVIGANA